ncbi:MAG: threonylcarbamoyl-AMP synthase [Deltaproteobacteria bacterium]|nr:threonylcarbamoyl-AMP synthase [Deltaproteobacteria bacterium]
MRIEIHPQNPQPRFVKEVAAVFENGGLVVYPTGAGYSVGCSVHTKKAIDRLYHLKRAIKKYFMAMMFPDFSSMTEFVEIETTAYRYMKDKLPGPYTFILPATKKGKKILDVRRPEIGIRVPRHPFFQCLQSFYQHPILNTAAKIDEEDYLIDPDDIEEKFGSRVDMIVDSGVVPIKPTTIISLVTGVPELVRQGEGVF